MPADVSSTASVNLLADPLSVDVASLFDGCYELMVQILGRLFVHAEESEEELAQLADTAIGLMLDVIEPLGSALTRMPAGPPYPGVNAGPGFRLSRGAAIPTGRPQGQSSESGWSSWQPAAASSRLPSRRPLA
jgi:hypothetical protein